MPGGTRIRSSSSNRKRAHVTVLAAVGALRPQAAGTSPDLVQAAATGAGARGTVVTTGGARMAAAGAAQTWTVGNEPARAQAAWSGKAGTLPASAAAGQARSRLQATQPAQPMVPAAKVWKGLWRRCSRSCSSGRRISGMRCGEQGCMGRVTGLRASRRPPGGH